MNLLARAAELIGLKTSFSREVTPVKEAYVKASPYEWAGEGVLRKLAADHDAGLTNWVLASDMSELFKKIDLFNEQGIPRDRISLRISSTAEDYLCCVIKRQAHLTPEAKGKKWESFEAERDLGPQGIGYEHLMVQCGGQFARAYYHADAMNTNFNIETPNGWVKFEFGMDYLTRDADNKDAAPLLSLNL